LRALLLRTLVPAIGTPLYRLLGWTWRYREVRKSIMDDAQASDRPVVGAFLHARTFQLLHYNSRPQHGRWVLMCSQSRDGEAMARVEEGLGYTVERGSSGGGGSRALVGMIKRLRKDSSWSTCLAVDGSRGPRGVAQLGVLTLAQRTGGVILPVAASSNASLVYRWSWDRTVLPLPFAPVHVVFGEAIEVPDGLDEAGMEDIRARLERRLLELHEEADRLSGFRDSVPLQASTEQAG
jgi:hypothetical protein